MKLTLLPSDKGDCLLLEASNDTTILIDGGMADSYIKHVRPFLGKWRKKNKRPLDLVYLSHIDQDHIAGVLQLMNDLVAWRVFRHKKAKNEPWDEPSFPEPPDIARLWHNGFHDLIGDNAGDIGSILAARAAQLNNSANAELRKLGAEYQAIAASIPESIRLSGRVSAQQLNIPLNKEFGGKLAILRDPPDEIRLKNSGSLRIRIVGPFEKDLERLREKWNAWLRDKKNKANLNKTRAWRDEEDQRLDFSSILPLDIDDELGDRKQVTEENLASLLLFVEQQGKRILLTGDGHSTDIVRGLKHNGLLAEKGGLHVNVLKVQHHGSEHNLDRAFARTITADHYVICGNGRHENPDLRVLKVIAESRIGTKDESSANPETGNVFNVWFNCSVAFLEREIAERKAEKQPFKELTTAAEHFAKIEGDMHEYAAKSDGKMKLHFLKNKPLELELS